MSGKYSSASFYALFVDGYDFLAAKVKGFTFKQSAQMEPATGLGDSVTSVLPTGLSTLEITQSGAFFDDSTTGAHALLSASASAQTQRVVVAVFAGNVIGRMFVGASGTYADTYEPAPAVGGLTKANITYKVTGAIDRGVILSAVATKTASWNTKTDGASVDYTLDPSQIVIPITSATKANPCVVTTPVPHNLTTGQKILTSSNTLSGPSINSEQAVTVISATTFSVAVNTTASTGAGTGGSFVRSSTVNGGSSIQAVSAFSGFSGFVGTVRHSADDTTYADLVAHSNVTSGPTAERVTVAAGTTVNRYLCFSGALTGSGSITQFAGFTRA